MSSIPLRLNALGNVEISSVNGVINHNAEVQHNHANDSVLADIKSLKSTLQSGDVFKWNGSNVVAQASGDFALSSDLSSKASQSDFETLRDLTLPTTYLRLDDASTTYATLTQHNDLITVVSGKANGSDVSSLQTDVGTLQTSVSSLQSDVGTLQTDVANVQSDVSGKASQSDVSTLQGDVSTLQTGVSALQGDVSTLQTNVSSLQGDVSSKASQSALDALDVVVANKALQSDLTSLQTVVDGKASQSALDNLDTVVAGKASQSDLNTLQTDLNLKLYLQDLGSEWSSLGGASISAMTISNTKYFGHSVVLQDNYTTLFNHTTQDGKVYFVKIRAVYKSSDMSNIGYINYQGVWKNVGSTNSVIASSDSYDALNCNGSELLVSGSVNAVSVQVKRGAIGAGSVSVHFEATEC